MGRHSNKTYARNSGNSNSIPAISGPTTTSPTKRPAGTKDSTTSAEQCGAKDKQVSGVSPLQDDFDSFLRENDSTESRKVSQKELNIKLSVRACADPVLQNQVKEIDASNGGQQIEPAVTKVMASAPSDCTDTSITNPTVLQEKQVIPPQAWISRQPQAALPAMSSSVAHIPRNVMGDAAWPPVRPPSSGPAEAENRFQTDQGAASMAALAAWRTPSQPVRDEDVAAALAELMRLGTPQPSNIQVPPALPPPLGLQPPPHVPTSIDLELLRDPEAEVRAPPSEPVPAPADRTTVRYYTNSEANKRGALTEQPRTRQVREGTVADRAIDCSREGTAHAFLSDGLSPLAPPPPPTWSSWFHQSWCGSRITRQTPSGWSPDAKVCHRRSWRLTTL